MRIMHSRRRLFFRQTVKLLLNNKPTMRINTHSLVRRRQSLHCCSSRRLSHISFDELGARDQVHSSSLSAWFSISLLINHTWFSFSDLNDREKCLASRERDEMERRTLLEYIACDLCFCLKYCVCAGAYETLPTISNSCRE